MKNSLKRVALPVGAAVILGTTGFAFMASNSVPTSFAGDGQGAISGYNVSGIEYATNDDFIFSVKFDLDSPARAENVSAFIERSNGTSAGYEKCRSVGGSSYVCDPGPDTIVVPQGQAMKLRVVAAQ